MADSVSEAEFSEEAGAATGAGTGSKSSELKKKERIRDNQRRSRARRQEHLADLEKRVAASHAACREAEMQRGAFRDAQIENTRLRDLLRIAGVNDATVQSYVNQGIGQAEGADSTHRTLRPRISVEHERQRSTDGRDESARTSPYPDVSAMRRLNVEPDSGLSRLSATSTSLASRHSPQVSQAPMMPHMLQGAHIQHLNIFQPGSPHREDDSCWGGFEIPTNTSWRA